MTLQELTAEHREGRHTQPRSDCFACFLALGDEVARLRAVLGVIAEGAAFGNPAALARGALAPPEDRLRGVSP